MIASVHRKHVPRAGSVRRDVCISACILAACSLIGFLFYSQSLSEANIISVYILGILAIASLTSGWIYGTVSSVVGVLLFNCLYAEPHFNFWVYDWQYAITAVVMLIASLITNYVMTLFRRQLDREVLETRRLDILLETSQRLLQTQDEQDIFAVTLTQLFRMFDRPILLFPVSDGNVLQPMIKVPEKDGSFFPESWGLDEASLRRGIHGAIASEDAVILAGDGKKAMLLPVRGEKTVFAVAGIIVDSGKTFDGFEHNLLLAILDEAALSFEKHHLHVCNERIAREAEAERLRANLLRAISHDLRTPLTSISGNADILLSNGEQIRPDLRGQLYQHIYDDSEWLINMVENLLFVTRIENGVMSITTEPEVLQELIPEALNRFARRNKGHNISLEMPDELLIVAVDARLVIQVLVNIVDNAMKYTPPGSDIAIRAFRRGSQAVVEVADTGGGISDEDKQKVFEMFYTCNNKTGDSRRGIGLGLPLCRSIVRAHGGVLHIADNAPSGAVVSFALQIKELCCESEYPGH